MKLTILLLIILLIACEGPMGPQAPHVENNCYHGVLSDEMRTFHQEYFAVPVPYILGMKVEVYCSMPGQKLWIEPEEWLIHEDGFVLIKEGTYAWVGYNYMVTLL